MIHRVRTITGHQGNELQRWVELAGAKSPAPPPNLFSREFRRLANVRFLITNTELPPEVPELPGVTFVHRAGPALTSTGNPMYLYEFGNEDNPAAWVAPVAVEAAPELILGTVLDSRFDPRRAAIFDAGTAVPTREITALPEPLDLDATVTYPALDRISVTLNGPAPEGSVLVVSENYYPGWRAAIDGAEVPIGRAQHTMIGVALPAGATQIDLEFSQRSYERGRVVTLVGLTLSLLLIGYGLAAERWRRG